MRATLQGWRGLARSVAAATGLLLILSLAVSCKDSPCGKPFEVRVDVRDVVTSDLGAAEDRQTLCKFLCALYSPSSSSCDIDEQFIMTCEGRSDCI